MHIVIDISEEMYEELKYLNVHGFTTATDEAIANGTPLPKGHGRLKDIDAIIDTLDSSDRDIYVKECLEEDAPTIIPAERESEEGQ